MKCPIYSKYKPSGVEWLGEVPEHWDVKRLKFVIAAPLKYGANEAAELDDPDLPRYVRITDIDDNDGLRAETFKSLPFDVASEYLLREGDILFARSGATAGKTFLYRKSWEVCAYAGYLIRARLDKRKGVPEYVRYFTASANYWQWLSSTLIQATIQNVSADRYASLWVPLPSLPEQRAIADFLDRETAKIDTLVAKKRTLIERLKEKRSALISRTVTRGLPPGAARAAGLDPHSKLKPSGIDWLGDVPEHWAIGKFSREVWIAEGQVDPEVEPYSSMILVAPNHIESGTGRLIALESAADQGAISGKYPCRAGEVIYSKIRPALAKAVIAPVDCLCSADMYPMTSTGRLHSHYLLLVLLSSQFTAWSVLEADRVAMPKVNRETLNDLRLPIPPYVEQEKIAEFVVRETAEIDAMIAKVETATERLQEYRTALITAAVTGKIDVRGTVARQPEPVKIAV